MLLDTLLDLVERSTRATVIVLSSAYLLPLGLYPPEANYRPTPTDRYTWIANRLCASRAYMLPAQRQREHVVF